MSINWDIGYYREGYLLIPFKIVKCTGLDFTHEQIRDMIKRMNEEKERWERTDILQSIVKKEVE